MFKFQHLEELYEKEKKLKKLINAKNKYLNMEKTPEGVGITGITAGIINQLGMLLDNSQRREFAIAIARSSDRMINLVNNILDLAHLNNDKFILNLQPVNFTDLLKEKFQEYKLKKKVQIYFRF